MGKTDLESLPPRKFVLAKLMSIFLKEYIYAEGNRDRAMIYLCNPLLLADFYEQAALRALLVYGSL